MRRHLLILATMLGFLAPAYAYAAPEIGKQAPDFSLTDAAGKPVSLAALKGKTVVLEWSNFGCPFVKKFYEPGAMQGFQKEAAKHDVVWITVFSSAEGKEGHQTAEQALAEMQKRGGAPAHIIMDPEGTLGRLYEAKTTPHMFVIDAKGTLAFMGAIDDKPTADPADIKSATNYVNNAIAALKDGKAVEPNNTKPYGCSVKYAQ